MSGLLSLVSLSSPFDYVSLKELSDVKTLVPIPPYETIIQDPSKIQQVIKGILSKDNGDSLIADLLIELRKNIHNDIYFTNIVLEFLRHTPNGNPLILLMEKNLSIFVNILTQIPHNHRFNRKSILGILVSGNVWQELVANSLIRCKDESDGGDFHQTLSDYATLLDIPSNHLNNFLVYFLEKKKHFACFALILSTINKKNAIFGLMKFTERYLYPFHFVEYRSLIESLSCLKIYPEKMYFYTYLIDIFRQKDKLNHLYSVLSTFSFQSRSLLMPAMKPSEQARIFERCINPKIFCDFLESLCFFNKGYTDKKELVNLAFQTIQSDQHSKRKTRLKKIVLELVSRSTWITPYLLISLPFAELQPILSDLTPIVRTRLFTCCEPDSSTSELLKELMLFKGALLELLYSELFFDLNPLPIEGETPRTNSLTEPTAIGPLIDQFIIMPSEFIANYASEIKMIPPLLLGVACCFNDQIEVLQRLIPHLTDYQIIFSMKAMTDENIYEELGLIKKDLRTHQYQMILLNLQESQLITYTTKRIEAIQGSFRDFQTELQQFSIHLKSFEKKALIKTLYDEFYLKALTFRGNALSIVNRDVYTLVSCLARMNNDSHIKFIEILRTIINQFEGIYNRQLAPQKSLFMQLALVERNIILDEQSANDIFENIYPEFWSTMTERVLVHLDISPNSPLQICSAGELHLVGITSDADLKIIGISKEQQTYLDQIIMILNGVKASDGEAQYQLSEKWNKFLDIKLNDRELKEALIELINFLDINNVDQDLLKKTVKLVCENLIALNDLSEAFKMAFRKVITSIDNLEGLALVKFTRRVIARQALAIRRRQTLCKLQSYLKQPGLRSCWQRLRTNSFNSLHELSQAKHLVFRRDAFQLQSLTNVLFVSTLRLSNRDARILT